ncbi:hypothetical protein NL676_007100, partial [Syzygium grande]
EPWPDLAGNGFKRLARSAGHQRIKATLIDVGRRLPSPGCGVARTLSRSEAATWAQSRSLSLGPGHGRSPCLDEVVLADPVRPSLFWAGLPSLAPGSGLPRRLENTTSGDPHRQWENLVTKVWKSEYGFFYFSFSEAQQLPL